MDKLEKNNSDWSCEHCRLYGAIVYKYIDEMCIFETIKFLKFRAQFYDYDYDYD